MDRGLEDKVLDLMYEAVLRLSKDAAVKHVRQTKGDEAAEALRVNLDTQFGEYLVMTMAGIIIDKYRDIIGDHPLLRRLEVHIEAKMQRVISMLEAGVTTIH